MTLRQLVIVPGLLTLWPMAGCNKDSQSTGGKLPEKTNLLLVTLDTTRADRLGCYGYAGAATPTLDALAARAVVFEDAQSVVPLTLPSHATIMTGRYPREHGLRINGEGRLGDGLPTLAAAFKDKGYATGAFVSAFVLDDQFGLARGFTAYDDEVEISRAGQAGNEAERKADAVTDAALKWLQADQEKPFFCWVHYYDPHQPYEPPVKFRQAGADLYDGEIAFMDSQLSQIIQLLESKKLMGRTLIVVAGDHGESMGEHAEFGHKVFLYETNLRVPLIFAMPSTAWPARRVKEIVSLGDVFPTVLDLFGWKQPEGLRGRSLMAPLRGEPFESQPCYAESEYVYRVHNWAQQRALVTPQWKYISSARPELYDRQADRAETRNLITQRADIAEKLQRQAQEEFSSMQPGVAGKTALSEEAMRRLQSLGYISGGQAPKVEEFLTGSLPDPKDLMDVMDLLRDARRLDDAGRDAESMAVLERATERSPQSLGILNQLGSAYLKADRLQDSIAVFQKAVRINPESTSALGSLGAALMKAGRRQEAIQHYELALAVDPDDALSQFNLGTALLQDGQVDLAIARLRTATRLRPKYGEALLNLGIALSKKRDWGEAEKSLREAVAAGSNATEAHYVLSQVALEQARWAEMEQELRKTLELEPGHVKARDALYKYYLKNQRSAEAVAVLRSSLQRSPDDADAVLTLAEILACSVRDEVRNGAEAVRLVEPLVEMTHGQDIRALAILAAAKAETGDFETAMRTIEKALTIAESKSDEKLVGFLRAEQEAFRSKRPFRNPLY